MWVFLAAATQPPQSLFRNESFSGFRSKSFPGARSCRLSPCQSCDSSLLAVHMRGRHLCAVSTLQQQAQEQQRQQPCPRITSQSHSPWCAGSRLSRIRASRSGPWLPRWWPQTTTRMAREMKSSQSGFLSALRHTNCIHILNSMHLLVCLQRCGGGGGEVYCSAQQQIRLQRESTPSLSEGICIAMCSAW